MTDFYKFLINFFNIKERLFCLSHPFIKRPHTDMKPLKKLAWKFFNDLMLFSPKAVFRIKVYWFFFSQKTTKKTLPLLFWQIIKLSFIHNFVVLSATTPKNTIFNKLFDFARSWANSAIILYLSITPKVLPYKPSIIMYYNWLG